MEKIPADNELVTAKELALVLGVWLLSILFLLITRAELPFCVIWGEISLYGVVLWWYSVKNLLPQIIGTKDALVIYIAKMILIWLLSFFPIAFIAFFTLHRKIEAAFYLNLFNLGFSLILVAPASWLLFKHRFNKAKEIQGLKTSLGNSSAHLDFLRSQINPHFLFNILNTLYGTAIQEKAKRTGEGIQKLGDMMRFMLQDYRHERISLLREIDYLKNYIDLQKLRTQVSSAIVIDTELDIPFNDLEIAPMVLIPFVENAFKHGISLREYSHIKVFLEIKGDRLSFEVYNTVHSKIDNDPEKNQSGIGLENVKQRLKLLYPFTHELIIRENVKDFFVHLNLQLS